MPSDLTSKPLPYRTARRVIRDGDLLLFRRKPGLMGRIISVAGRSKYSHAAMAATWNDRLMCVEMTTGGGRAQLLSNQVERWPGVIDVYRVNTRHYRFNDAQRKAAVVAMIELTSHRYGWWALFGAAILHLPIWRFLVTPDTDDEANGHLPFCSMAVARAYRAAGIDPVPNLADKLTEPGDLSRSPVFQYRCTLGISAPATVKVA